ncbi:MAG: acyl carrier protein [Candidatus Omnitrophica bacterium]|nr:acyl carrier protein [Candidatus Omnitrophota bacterium]
MDQIEILKKLNGIFNQVLHDPAIVLKSETTASDVEGWDSLTHVQLIFAIEKEFKIRFSALEIQQFANVGDICQKIQERQGSRAC